MHSDKYFADIQARIADGTLSYSPETAAAIHAHARAMRAIEMSSMFGRAVRALGSRLAASFTKTPAAARADAR
jgi:hypothetical protein